MVDDKRLAAQLQKLQEMSVEDLKAYPSDMYGYFRLVDHVEQRSAPGGVSLTLVKDISKTMSELFIAGISKFDAAAFERFKGNYPSLGSMRLRVRRFGPKVYGSGSFGLFLETSDAKYYILFRSGSQLVIVKPLI